MKAHIPKVDTGDDYDFMCGTHAFGATISARDVCQSCIKKALEIVELLSEAYDELNVAQRGVYNARRARLMKRIDAVLGKRATVDYPDDEPPQPRCGHIVDNYTNETCGAPLPCGRHK